ncbi:translation initiation factor IF-2 subunit gamma [archaeon]|jgi:translation initiation factor 2 subunit 3|nr:translation initiation factor IF-2 subunit gamma [archaeon]MBT3451626.1 translation initiation factor IF-2 subunit gamma [archaeon]MBT6869647.1 translation initiation factor IF-2 subunit gamma [archaeon]MBT7192415.1 translation initiation factor IF-2 subunit gamma [archaeon]MBT7380216.1 translation initiation factor IF-2 subunit gamma [archaeon]
MAKKKIDNDNEEIIAKKKVVKKKTTTKKSSKIKEDDKIKNSKTNSDTEKVSKNIDEIQPQLNIALVGHVDHGKTTLTERLSGKWTDTHSEELKKGITIRLGYADVNVYYCEKCDFYTTKPVCVKCNGKPKFERKLSLVDAPGHESLMATMLSGASIVDGAILLVAANEKCPQAQTREHLMALQISGIKKVIIVQNKIDLVTTEKAIKNYNQIKEFLSKTEFADAPIIPISARANANIGTLVKVMQEYFEIPERNINDHPIMLVARSFDINKPGTKIKSLKGGVLGGTVKQGEFKIGDKIEILPGYMVEERNRKIWKPLSAKITQIFTGGSPVEQIGPGGSMAISTTLDPCVVKSDSLTGSLVGKEGTLPPVHYQIKLDTHLLERVVGSKEDLEVKPLAKNEPLMLNVNASVTVGVVVDPSKKNTLCMLKKPIVAEYGERVTISRRVGDRFRLIGYGILKK